MFFPKLDYDYTMFIEENLPNTSGTHYDWPELHDDGNASLAEVADMIRREEHIARAAVRHAARLHNERRASSC